MGKITFEAIRPGPRNAPLGRRHVVRAMRGMLGAAVLFCCILPSAPAGVPSFLCSKANTWLEKTVCASDRLSALDLELAVAYARVLKVVSGSSEKAFTKEQNTFWGARSACRKDKDPNSCLEDRYVSRIAELKGRPDYPGDEPGPQRVVFTESLIKEGGKGWAQNMSNYMKAIRSCVAKSKPRPRAVLTAWSEEEGELVGMRLRGAAGQDWLCIAKKDGSQPHVRAREAVETVPEAGPILWLTKGPSPGEACKKSVQVLDTDDTPVGWLAEAKC
jgi:uncharacterized protein